MGKPTDIPQDVWEKAEMLVISVDGAPTDGSTYNIAKAILSAVEEENEACALEALRWEDGIDAAEHIRRRNRKGA